MYDPAAETMCGLSLPPLLQASVPVTPLAVSVDVPLQLLTTLTVGAAGRLLTVRLLVAFAVQALAFVVVGQVGQLVGRFESEGLDDVHGIAARFWLFAYCPDASGVHT